MVERRCWTAPSVTQENWNPWALDPRLFRFFVFFLDPNLFRLNLTLPVVIVFKRLRWPESLAFTENLAAFGPVLDRGKLNWPLSNLSSLAWTSADRRYRHVRDRIPTLLIQCPARVWIDLHLVHENHVFGG